MARKKTSEFEEMTLSQVKSAYVSLQVRTMYNIQDMRKRASNRIFAFRERGKDMDNPLNENFNAMADELDALVKATLTTLESELEKRVSKSVANLPIIKWLEAVHGIGPRYSGSLVALVLDIERFATVSRLWSYLGMGLVPICTECGKIAYFGRERMIFAERQANRRWDLYITSHEYADFVSRGYPPDEDSFKAEKVLDVCGARFSIKNLLVEPPDEKLNPLDEELLDLAISEAFDTDDTRRLLIDEDDSPTFVTELLDRATASGEGVVPELLRSKFWSAGVYLSNKAIMEANVVGKRWTIKDPRKGTPSSVNFKLLLDPDSDSPVINITTKGVLCAHDIEVARDSALSVEVIAARHKAKEPVYQAVMRAPSRRYFVGLLLTHTPFGKTTCWKIAGQFVRQGDFYRKHYDKVKDRYTERDGTTKSIGHIDNMARRATVKLFLSHFWMMWRRSLNLPIGEIWLQKQRNWFTDGHTFIPPPHKDIYGSFDNNTEETSDDVSSTDIAAG